MKGTAGIRTKCGGFEVILSCPRIRYLYIGFARALPDAQKLKAAATLAVFGKAAAASKLTAAEAAAAASLTAEELQLDAGAAVEAVTTGGRTPLHDAAIGGNASVIELLLDAGAAVAAADAAGVTALHYAALNACADVVQLLLDAGASVTATRAGGIIPLHSALQRRRFDAAARLVNAMKPAHADLAKEALARFPQDVQGDVHMALAGWVATMQAQAQQQQEQLDRDRQQVAAERTAAQELLVAACLGMSRMQAAAEPDDADEYFSVDSCGFSDGDE
ncbi:hypothetical protein OEZ86_009582 [Tetradesmus obliquus]|uniref:Uncharacterized protein n=1 Tax=Tetradesmus obliquus TaxID=3088 RepID=A0ABY8UM36_TETOB|nr:hypothetical protein OEZ85_001027 [Tetradesmus obliquus]WIA43053.1 hypothetical protein OEZ86_009582 [Tetradesmus obliquus]